MSIRIDGQGHPSADAALGTPPAQPSDPEAARRLESTNPAERSSATSTSRKGASSADRVEVSSDAQLVTTALRAADEVPAVRTDAVERARKSLEENRLGTDSSRLAERIINSLLGE